MNMTRIKKYVDLHARKTKLEAELASVKEKLTELEPLILEQFEKAGIQNMKVGDWKPYVHSQIWASVDKSNPRAMEILKANGLADLVSETVNSQSLSAYVREQVRLYEDADSKNLEEVLKQALPDELLDVLKVSEKTSLRVVKA
ncbi:MAG TPA: hypothetical protein PKG85_09535 [Mesotoga infera]|nr:hypothetical protein [Mesotoga infera]